MKRCWKELTKMGDILATSPDELVDLMEDALCSEWKQRERLLQELKTITQERQSSLFPSDTHDLNKLQQQHADDPLAQVAIKCVARHQAAGDFGDDAIEKAVCEATEIMQGRAIRQIEEHCHRKTTTSRADNIRMRLENAGQRTSCIEVTRAVLERNYKIKRDSSPISYGGLDDGVPLYAN